MSENGFFFDELSEYKQNLLREAEKLFPQTTEEFLKKEGRRLTALHKKRAKQDVGTSKGKKRNWDEKKSYHKKFKTGKIYDYQGDKCVRAYNSARHSHLIEYGHKMKDGKFVPGRYVFKVVQNQFKHIFEDDCDKFLNTYMEDLGDHK